MISTPSSARPRAKSTSPRLSDTDRSARRTWTSPAATTPGAWGSACAISYPHLAALHLDGTGRDQPDGARQKLMLDLVDACLDGLDIAMVRKLERFLQDDGAGVDALLHEVDGHAGDPHPVVE